MFLDIWTAGGVLSLAALLALIVKAAIDSVASVNASDTPAQDETRSIQSLITGVAAAYGLVFFLYFISGDGFDWRLAAMAPLAVGVLACQISANGPDVRRVGVIAALVALMVHLLGADGIEFPAVLQTLLLFAIFLDDPLWKPLSKTTSLAATGLFGVLAVGCLLTGIVPVLNGGALTSRAMEAYAAGDPLAERLLNEAIEADPLANAPLMLRAQLASARAASSGRAADVVDARRSWDLLLQRDPRNLAARRGLAEVLLSSGSSGDAQAAAELLAEAVALSPTDSELRVEAAHAFAKAGQNQQAAEQAAEALRLDDINRKAGHTDILLDEGTREEMQAAVGNAGRVP
jgi:hypothetical protein